MVDTLLCPPLYPFLLQYNDQILQVFTSSLFLAAAFTALVGMWSCKRYGRRVTMLMGGLAFCIGEVVEARLQRLKAK